jgi:hypothetical protein
MNIGWRAQSIPSSPMQNVLRSLHGFENQSLTTILQDLISLQGNIIVILIQATPIKNLKSEVIACNK